METILILPDLEVVPVVQSVIRVTIGLLSMASSIVVLKIVIMDTSVYPQQMASSLAIAIKNNLDIDLHWKIKFTY